MKTAIIALTLLCAALTASGQQNLSPPQKAAYAAAAYARVDRTNLAAIEAFLQAYNGWLNLTSRANVVSDQVIAKLKTVVKPVPGKTTVIEMLALITYRKGLAKECEERLRDIERGENAMRNRWEREKATAFRCYAERAYSAFRKETDDYETRIQMLSGQGKSVWQ